MELGALRLGALDRAAGAGEQKMRSSGLLTDSSEPRTEGVKRLENPIIALVGEGLRLMAIGMSIVFVFLLLLVGVLTLMSRLVMRYAPETESLAAIGGLRYPLGDGRDDEELVAVITAAVVKYRATHDTF